MIHIKNNVKNHKIYDPTCDPTYDPIRSHAILHDPMQSYTILLAILL